MRCPVAIFYNLSSEKGCPSEKRDYNNEHARETYKTR